MEICISTCCLADTCFFKKVFVKFTFLAFFLSKVSMVWSVLLHVWSVLSATRASIFSVLVVQLLRDGTLLKLCLFLLKKVWLFHPILEPNHFVALRLYTFDIFAWVPYVLFFRLCETSISTWGRNHHYWGSSCKPLHRAGHKYCWWKRDPPDKCGNTGSVPWWCYSSRRKAAGWGPNTSGIATMFRNNCLIKKSIFTAIYRLALIL